MYTLIGPFLCKLPFELYQSDGRSHALFSAGVIASQHGFDSIFEISLFLREGFGVRFFESHHHG